MKTLNTLQDISGGIHYSLEFQIRPDMQDDDIAAIACKSGLPQELIVDALTQSIDKNKNVVISIDMTYQIFDTYVDVFSDDDYYDYFWD